MCLASMLVRYVPIFLQIDTELDTEITHSSNVNWLFSEVLILDTGYWEILSIFGINVNWRFQFQKPVSSY